MDTSADLKQLEECFAFPGLKFDHGKGGLIRAVIATPVAEGELYLHGAHVTHYRPSGQDPVLWLSQQSNFSTGKPIRGGVPICFPWFGLKQDEPGAPAHGLARTAPWQLTASGRHADGGVVLELNASIADFVLAYRVHFGSLLSLSLTVELPATAAAPVTFEEALHTYLAVGDARHVVIEGLENHSYLDKVGAITLRPESLEPIRFTGETDRVYLNTIDRCRLRDDRLRRTIVVEKAGSRSTVIWNPWVEKSIRMPDFGDEEWTDMACIETANIGDQSICLQPGSTHTLVTRIEVFPEPQ